MTWSVTARAVSLVVLFAVAVLPTAVAQPGGQARTYIPMVGGSDRSVEPAPSTQPSPSPRPSPSSPPVPSPRPSPSSQPSVCTGIGIPSMDGTRLGVTTASYLGSSGADVANAVDIGADCAVVVAGRFPDLDLGTQPVALAGGGAGTVIRLTSNGTAVLSLTRLGDDIRDLEIRRGGDGRIAVAGSFGVALLTSDAGRLLWIQPGDASRVAIGSDGTVAVLRANTVTLYDVAGGSAGSFTVTGATDLAMDSASGTIVVTGFRQDDGYTCSQLQIPFLRGYSYVGVQKWRAYDWSKIEAGDRALCADSRGYRVAVGRDGYVYFAGESAGGNTVYHRDPHNIDQAAANLTTDPYTNPYNLNGAAHILYYGRFRPADGSLITGQFAVVRLSNGKANAVRVADGNITADEAGNVYVSGATACCLPQPMSINGAQVGAAYAGGGFVLAVSADFTQRRLWMIWDSGAPAVRGVAAGSGIVAMAASATSASMFTYQPVQTAPHSSIGSGASDGFVSVWPGYR